MMMNINYEYYRTFYYVARYGNFTKAANVLRASQPNITRNIANLENQLGCKLFVRSNRGVTLTPEGEKLFSHIEIVQEQIQQAEEELVGNKGFQTGHISIACSETALHLLLLEKLGVFHERYPGIQLKISNHSTPQAVAALERGAADFAVVTTPLSASKTLETIELMEFNEILVGSVKGKNQWKESLTFEQLKQYSLVMLGKETMTYAYYNELFSRKGIILSPDIEVATTEQLLPMIRANLGIGFVPEPMAMLTIGTGEICRIPFQEELPARQVVLVRDRRRPMSMAAKELAVLLKKGNE